MLAECDFCAHRCGVNRLEGERGLCHAGPEPRVFAAQVEVSDELELIPTFSIAFSGCDLRCDFCITGGQSWNPLAGELFDAMALAGRALSALEQGARSVMILGGEPTIYLPSVLEFVGEMPAETKLVWKTNAHGTEHARGLLDGMFDVWVADYKFGNDVCAERLAKVRAYSERVQENLCWAARHTDLIIRHLLMPGHLDCCWRPVAEWLTEHMSGVKINLRSGFWPAWHAARHPELRGAITLDETQRAVALAKELRLNLVA